jgi:hypothetical protein
MGRCCECGWPIGFGGRGYSVPGTNIIRFGSGELTLGGMTYAYCPRCNKLVDP